MRRLSLLQLFRRVAAALPGMDTTQDKSKEDSILFFQYLCPYSPVLEMDLLPHFLTSHKSITIENHCMQVTDLSIK